MSAFPRFRAAHLSGKWNRPSILVRGQLKRAELRGATIISLTEVADGKRPEAVRLRGWSKAQRTEPHFDLGESAILSKDSTWEMLRFRVYVIGPDLGPGNRIVMVMALLKHRQTSKTLVYSVAHMPSAVEAVWFRGARPEQYRLAIDRWRRINLAWRRAFKPDAEATVADWNLNFHLSWVRQYFQERWPGLDLPHNLPKGGTHGYRLIDMIRSRGLGRILLTIRESRGASDHRELWIENL